MGSTRSGLLTPTFAVANDILAAALSAPRYFASSAFTSSTSDASAVEPSTTRSHRTRRSVVVSRRPNHHRTFAPISRPITLAERIRTASEVAITSAVTSLHALLHAYAGRLALDEWSRTAGTSRRAIRHMTDRAVKNLRFAHSAVLLLNFREVSDFHFCSISVAM